MRSVALPELEPSIHKYFTGPPPSDGPLDTVEPFDSLPTIPPTEALDIDASPPQLQDSNLPSTVTSDSSTIHLRWFCLGRVWLGGILSIQKLIGNKAGGNLSRWDLVHQFGFKK